MRISRPFFALLAATAVAAGCGKDSNAPDNPYLGTYALVSIDGAPLPLTVFDQPTLSVRVRAGSLALAANKSFTQTLDLLLVVNGVPLPPEAVTCGGSYSRNGNNFTFTSVETQECPAVTANGTLAGKTLTFTEEGGSTLVFQR